MAHFPDVVQTYDVSSESKAYPVPTGSTNVTFISSVALWATGGTTEETTIAVPRQVGSVYVPEYIQVSVRLDQTIFPWFAVRTHALHIRGFVTAIWHNNSEEEELVHDLRAWLAQQ